MKLVEIEKNTIINLDNVASVLYGKSDSVEKDYVQIIFIGEHGSWVNPLCFYKEKAREVYSKLLEYTSKD